MIVCQRNQQVCAFSQSDLYIGIGGYDEPWGKANYTLYISLSIFDADVKFHIFIPIFKCEMKLASTEAIQ